MKKINLIKSLTFLPILVFLVGSFNFVVVSAYDVKPGDTTNSATGQGTVPNTGTGNGTLENVELENPLKVDSLSDLLIAILNIVTILMIPVIVFFIIYAGFRYVMAQGNASQVEEATKSLTYAVIGGVLILGAVAIAEIIKNLVNAFAATP